MKEKKYWYYRVRRLVRALYVLLLACSLLLLLVYSDRVNVSHTFLGFALTALAAVVIITYIIGRVYVFNPMKNLKQTFELFNRGYIYEELFHNNFVMDEEMEKMLKKLEVMTDRNAAVDMAEKQVEYLTLQNQMNPHFLYNTLESIRAEALIAGQTSIANMSEALSKFFRYTITNKENIVTLADELENVKNYFKIQKYRFEDRIHLEIHCDDEEMLFQCWILKLTLQPLVENAIQHGVEAEVGRGTIEIDFERTKTKVFISVRDYGAGMEEEKIVELNRMFQEPDKQITAAFSKKKSGIALRNVNARIKMLFGMEYGLYILGSMYAGTEIRITLPNLDESMAKGYIKALNRRQKGEKM
ncbi:MAG: sensor histidine kinase [Ruminococcus sp.]|jgi:two-component system sensor histidine kinase YesM